MVHAAMKSEKTRNQKLGRCVKIFIDLLKYVRHVYTGRPPTQHDSLLTRLAFQLVATDTCSRPYLMFNPHRCLLMERDTVRPDSPLTQRLMRKALVLHN